MVIPRGLLIASMMGGLALIAAVTNVIAADPTAPPSAPMESVVVTAQKIRVQTFIDRKVYTVTDDLHSSFGTLSDVLTDIPSVNVDPDGIVTLRGDSHVLILIDGKPSALFSGSNAGDNLQSFPAANIERIEVITTPPPQYQAAGAAGVINIITRKGQEEAINGSVRASQGNDGRSVASADLSYRSEKLTISTDLGFRHDVRQKLLKSDIRAPLTPAASTLETGSSLLEHSWREVPSASADAEYALDETDSINGAFSWLRTGGPRDYSELTKTTDGSGAAVGALAHVSRGHNPEATYDERLGYVRKLARAGEELEISVHRSTSHEVTRYDYSNDSLIPASLPYDSYLTQNEQDTTTEVGLDYIVPISTGREFKLGYLFAQDDYGFSSNAGEDNPVTHDETIDPASTDDFKYSQRVDAGYVSYKVSAGKWSLLGGLRLEDTTTHARVPTDDIASRDHYLGLFPSLHVERSLPDAGTLSFGASRRVSRPDPQQLDPNINPEYSLILRAGNLHLLPEYTQSYELGYGGSQGHDLSYQVTGYYRRNHDSTSAVIDYLGDGVSLSTLENLRRDDFAGLELTTDGHVGSQIAYGVSANLFEGQVDASSLGNPGLRSTRGVDAKLKLDFSPTERDLAQLNISRTDRRLTSQGYISAMNVVNLGYRHRVRGNVSALATVSDVFNGQRTQTTVSTAGFSGDFVRAIRGPIMYVGVNCSFGSRNVKDADFRYEP